MELAVEEGRSSATFVCAGGRTGFYLLKRTVGFGEKEGDRAGARARRVGTVREDPQSTLARPGGCLRVAGVGGKGTLREGLETPF